MFSTQFCKAPCFAARPLVARSRRAGPVQPRAVAARDERVPDDSEASGVLSGEWAPTWSLSLPSRRPAAKARNTIARGTASQELEADPSQIITHLEWPAESEWAMASWNDVQRHCHRAWEKRHNGHQ